MPLSFTMKIRSPTSRIEGLLGTPRAAFHTTCVEVTFPRPFGRTAISCPVCHPVG
jgi:hypothetical protein